MESNSNSEPTQPFAYARLKIYNKDRGYLLMGITISKWHFKGGDGVSSIPEWVAVNKKQAQLLSKVQQTDNPSSPKAFDIVTPEERFRIDSVEELERKFQLGIIPRPSMQRGPRANVRGNPGAPAAPVRLDDLQDDDSSARAQQRASISVGSKPWEFDKPALLGEAPVEDSRHHEAFSSIASQDALDAAARQAQQNGPLGPPTDILPPAARAVIESLQDQILQLTRQITSIYKAPQPSPVATADRQDAQEQVTSPARRQASPPLPAAMEGRAAALTDLEAPAAPAAPEAAPEAPTRTTPTRTTPTRATPTRATEQPAAVLDIAPEPQLDDPALIAVDDDPMDAEEAAVFKKRENLALDIEDVEIPDDARSGFKTNNLNDDKHDKDLDIVLAEMATEQKSQDATKQADGGIGAAMQNAMASTVGGKKKRGK